jgi:hypothetical protein
MSQKKWIGVMTCSLLMVALGCSSGDGSGTQSPGNTTPGGTPDSKPCGNGKLDSGEACDGTNLNSKTCQTEGFQSGTLSCSASCTLNTASCIPASGGGATCGNGQVDDNEDCDGTNLDGWTCQESGFTSGTLSCSASCQLDTSKCTGKLCGNGKIDTTAEEECDGSNLGGKTCQSLGYTGGTLTCDPDFCNFDPSQCTGNPCGNGKIDPLEDCEGTNLGGQTCQSLGFSSGTLSCDSTDCWFNVDACVE